jgi:ElaA protein
VTTGENLRPGGSRRRVPCPPDPLRWDIDSAEGVFVGDVLGVTPQICRGGWEAITAGAAHALARLRVDVLVAEAGNAHPELDAQDLAPDTEHLWIADGDLAVACLRVVRDQDGVRCVDRVCARRDVRGLGLTSALVNDLVGRHGADRLRALARPEALPFFLQHGFEVCGPPSALPGGAHTPMIRHPEAPWR